MSGTRVAAVVLLGTLALACGTDPASPVAGSSSAPASPTASPGSAPTGDIVLGLPLPTRSVEPTAIAPSATRYVFPVAGSDVSYARAHHDYPATDIFAPCGSAFLSPVAGRVDEVVRVDTWSSSNDTGETRSGLAVSVVGTDGVRYYGSHLRAIATIAAGNQVVAGERLGEVGNTGNARGIACHLHFGISPPRGPGDWAVRRGVVSPYEYLNAWRAGRLLSPAPAVAEWAAAHPA